MKSLVLRRDERRVVLITTDGKTLTLILRQLTIRERA